MAGLKASVEVQDLTVFYKLLDRLGNKSARKIVRRSQQKAAKAMLEATKSAAPVDTGLLKSSLTVLPLKPKRGRVGFRVGYTNVKQIVAQSTYGGGKRGFYPAFVEYGTGTRPAHPFMRPAFNANKEAAKEIIVRELREGIIKEVQKQSIGGELAAFSKSSGLTKLAKRVRKIGKKAKKKGTRLLKRTKKGSRKLAKKAGKKFKREVKRKFK